jgi:ribosomal protein S18 acetylase RimI-like enzyme
MSAPSGHVIRWGRERARTGAWRGDRNVAFLAPVPEAPVPSAEFLRRCLRTLAERGYTRVVTPALAPPEQEGFLEVGFEVEERLHLLACDLDSLAPVPDRLALRRVGWALRPEVLQVDEAAFPPFWQFDGHGLDEALRATPRTRFRAAVATPGERRVLGYAICGRSGRRGFVQRLAVDPEAQRQGIGRGLLLDGLHWMRRRGVRRAVVNTQLGNEAALMLYQRCGFCREPSGLTVLSTGLQ